MVASRGFGPDFTQVFKLNDHETENLVQRGHANRPSRDRA